MSEWMNIHWIATVFQAQDLLVIRDFHLLCLLLNSEQMNITERGTTVF